MRPQPQGKHEKPLPKLRDIRRSCKKELYRTVKRLHVWIPEEKLKQAEQLYVQRVVGDLLWIAETGNNRKKLADWWDQHINDDIAELWDVDADRLSRAFRQAFGG